MTAALDGLPDEARQPRGHLFSLRLAQLVSDFDAIQELDLNPVHALVAGEGYRAVDARVVLATSPDGASGGPLSGPTSAQPAP